MRTFHRILSVIALLALILTSALLASAQSAQEDRQYDPQTDSQIADSQINDQPTQSDPPARAARLQYMSGSVSVQPHGTDDWVAGAVNRPLTNSDNIWADKNSRAEISVGTGLIRIDSESSLTLTNVAENMVQLQLHQGAMNLHVRRLYDNETYEVDTPNQAFTVRKPGDYRFDVDPNADKTIITVWRGSGESTGDGPAVRIHENQQARFSNGTSLTNDIHSAPSPDAFDEWASSRDRRLDHSASARYVSPDVVGYEDLDEYGTWRDSPEYGNVWVPSGVGVGWSPYRNGHWIWVAPWGWTWVEDEPWGYAPFHYGRWVYYDNFWGWAPGPIYARPYYSPALVAWFGGPGWGGSFGFGFGFGGGIGWCPLGFGEPFIPWYGVSRGYFNRVNITNTRITNITNITNIYNNTYINKHPGKPGGGGPYGPHSGQQIRYANMHAPNGFTAVSRNTLVNSQNVARNAVRISPNQLSRVSPVHSLDVKPTRTAMLGSNTGRSAAVPPQHSFARPVVSRVAPPAGSRGSFHTVSPTTNAGNGNVGRSMERPAQSGNVGRSMERPAQTGNVPRAENVPNRGATPNRASPTSNVRMPEQGSVASRSVPRPPTAGGFENRGMSQGTARSMPENSPRSSDTRPSAAPMSRPEPRSSTPEMASRSNVPHPPSASMPRSEGPSGAPRSMERPSSGPRETAPAPRSNERPGPRSEVSAPRPSPSYQANTRPTPNYGGSAYSRPTPSYGGGSYSRPAPSYDRGGSYGRSAPSYGGGSSGRSAPAYSGERSPSYSGGGSGGGRAPSYGGGGRSSGGYSGGHASAPSHSSGGSGAGSSHSNGGHGGHH